MCGRYTARFTDKQHLPASVGEIPAFAPRYNIAPQQKAPVIRLLEGQPKFEELRWGFRPLWLKDKNKAQINARAETLFSKPMFKHAALNRRCLVLASGWYEWQKQAEGKQPFAAQLFKFTGPVSEKNFAQQVKAGEDQDTDPKRFTTQVHEVTSVKIGQAICARSYFVTLDHAPRTHSHSGMPMILEALSLKCSHPDDPRVGVSVTYSERYYPGDVDPQFKTDATAVLDSVELTKLKE